MLNIKKVLETHYELQSHIRNFSGNISELCDNLKGYDFTGECFTFTYDGIEFRVLLSYNKKELYLGHYVYVQDLELDIHTLENLDELNSLPSDKLFY